MPTSRSAKKRLRQSQTRRMQNKARKSAVRTYVKRVVKALDSGEIETAESEYRLAAKKLDQAGSKGVIHPNKAARSKSRLQHRIKKAKSA